MCAGNTARKIRATFWLKNQHRATVTCSSSCCHLQRGRASNLFAPPTQSSRHMQAAPATTCRDHMRTAQSNCHLHRAPVTDKRRRSTSHIQTKERGTCNLKEHQLHPVLFPALHAPATCTEPLPPDPAPAATC